MLSSKTVVLDLEGFRHRKEKFIVKEFGICTEDYNDCVLFSPPSKFPDLTNPQKTSISWLSKNLHGLDWNSENYPYIYLTQIVQSVRLRNPRAVYYAKGFEKSQLLSELLDCPVIDLNTLKCPKISYSFFTVNCGNHSSTQRGIFNNHCAREKACFYFDWLTNERGIDESASTLVSEFDYLRLDHEGGDTEPFNLQRRSDKKWYSNSSEKS